MKFLTSCLSQVLISSTQSHLILNHFLVQLEFTQIKYWLIQAQVAHDLSQLIIIPKHMWKEYAMQSVTWLVTWFSTMPHSSQGVVYGEKFNYTMRMQSCGIKMPSEI